MLTDPALSLEIAEYEPELLRLALRLRGRDGAEVDDLVQEGRISIWAAISKGTTPSLAIAFRRMLMWVRTLRPQSPAPYHDLLEYDEG